MRNKQKAKAYYWPYSFTRWKIERFKWLSKAISPGYSLNMIIYKPPYPEPFK